MNGRFLDVVLQSPHSASFRAIEPTRLPNDDPPPEGEYDLPNPGINVLTIDLPNGTHNVAVLFSPQWSLGWTSKTVPVLPLREWGLKSHIFMES